MYIQQSTPQKFFKLFISTCELNSGIHENVDLNNNACSVGNESTSSMFKWNIDLALIRKGQKFIHKNFFAIFFAHLISLMFLLSYKPVRNVLKFTKKSNTSFKALRRYFSTLVHIQNWYDSDLTNVPNTDIIRIKELHSKISKHLFTRKNVLLSTVEESNECLSNLKDFRILMAVRKDIIKYYDETNQEEIGMEAIEYFDEEYKGINQIDMAVTQFCFMGLISLYPRVFGIQEYDDLNGFIHLWALIGKQIGIKDQYNICLTENLNLRRLILKDILLEEFRVCGISTMMLWNTLINGIGRFIPFLSLPAILKFIIEDLLKLEAQNTSSVFNLYDWISYKLTKKCFQVWIKIPQIRIFLNKMLKLAIYLTITLRFPKLAYFTK